MQPVRRSPVTDFALQSNNLSVAESPSRAKVLVRLRRSDDVFRILTRSAALAVLVILGGVIVSLIIGSIPALRAFGLEFPFSQSWNPVTEKFGALAPIYGTLVTSLIAMLIAVPVGLMVAFFLTELCPTSLRPPTGTPIHLLSVIPTPLHALFALSS